MTYSFKVLRRLAEVQVEECSLKYLSISKLPKVQWQVLQLAMNIKTWASNNRSRIMTIHKTNMDL